MANLFKIKRATKKDLGSKWLVLWNPQGVRDWNETPSYREGVVDTVGNDGSFTLDLGVAIMVCPSMYYGKRKNPFRNLIKV